MRRYRNAITVAGVAAALLLACDAHASTLLITITQTGANVLGAVSGSVDTASLTNEFNSKDSGFVFDQYPLGGSAIAVGSPVQADVTAYSAGTLGGLASLGSGGYFAASSGSGDTVGLATDIQNLGTVIYVPAGYVSGASLSGSSTWNGTTLAGLGLTAGDYLYKLGPAVTIDLNISSIDAAVPEPATWAMCLLGFGLIGFALRKRSNPADSFATT